MIKETKPLNTRPGVILNEQQAIVWLWAPKASQVNLVTEGNNELLPLAKQERGYWYTATNQLKAGSRYRFKVDDTEPLPDPASLSQPDGVHGPSEVVDLDAFSWTDADWNNLPLQDYIMYELHTGTFSPEGTFAGIEGKLGHLKALGVNAIEIMPVAQFPGSRNWGYDGVFPYAVQNSYGGAAGLQQLVNACHRHGIAVVLDVVYNHLGPEGNYFGMYGPYFTSQYNTPWGDAINFDTAGCDAVRSYFIENALMWLRDFHIDALRMDAVHAIKDLSAKHVLAELRERVDELIAKTGRGHYLIVENDLNDVRYINPPVNGGFGMDSQWIDEFHHALRIAAGGEPTGYYSDFNGIAHLAKAYNDAYVYDGQYSPHRDRHFGSKAVNNPGSQFVVFSQNHDQVGNRMLGERSSELFSFEMQKLMAGAVLTAPYIPMLFMGEEYTEPHRFMYFVSHTDEELANAVRQGRKNEFAAFHSQGTPPDPVNEQTFLQSKLQWELTGQPLHQTMLQFYQHLIALRKKLPALHKLNRKLTHATANVHNQTLILHRRDAEQEAVILMNFSSSVQTLELPQPDASWQLQLNSAHQRWGGRLPENTPETDACTADIQPQSFIIYTA